MSKVNKELLKICDWFQANRLSSNVKKHYFIIFDKKTNPRIRFKIV